MRARVGPDTWRAFWMIAIKQRPVREVADALGKTYVTVYYGHRRVKRLLREGGERRMAALEGSAESANE